MDPGRNPISAASTFVFIPQKTTYIHVILECDVYNPMKMWKYRNNPCNSNWQIEYNVIVAIHLSTALNVVDTMFHVSEAMLNVSEAMLTGCNAHVTRLYIVNFSLDVAKPMSFIVNETAQLVRA